MKENHSLGEYVTKTVLELTGDRIDVPASNARDEAEIEVPGPIRAAAVFIHECELGSHSEILDSINTLRRELNYVEHCSQKALGLL